MREEEDYIELLKEMTDNKINWFIRGNLIKAGKKLRFDFTGGYDDAPKTDGILHNQKILNTFAYLGLYDSGEFVSLRFHKGCPILMLNYDGRIHTYEDNLIGMTTTDIIQEIFKLTILR